MTKAIRLAAASLVALSALGAAGAYAASPAAPTSWTADPAKSTLEFDFVQAGAKTTGRFGKFTANIDFATTPAPQGRIDVSIDMNSVDTRDKDRDSQLRTADLFDVAKQPRALYAATQFTAKAGAFEGQGKLTLRGVTRDVPIIFNFQSSTEAGQPVALLKGTATIKRLQFGVGQGEWKSTEWISDDVQVNFTLRLVPRAAIPTKP